MNSQIVRITKQAIEEHYHRYNVAYFAGKLPQRMHFSTYVSKTTFGIATHYRDKRWQDKIVRTFCYLPLVLDAYSGKIVGWSVGATLGTHYTIEALRMALSEAEGSLCGLIHHSDRGAQYASREYVSLLMSNGICVSMTENGDPKENAKAERINGTIKNEMLKGVELHSVTEARETVAKAMEFYNNRRLHMSAGMMTPAQAAECEGELPKLWHSYREEAIKRQREEPRNTERGFTFVRESTLDGYRLSSVNLTKGYQPRVNFIQFYV